LFAEKNKTFLSFFENNMIFVVWSGLWSGLRPFDRGFGRGFAP
jgi:hypothetical protein